MAQTELTKQERMKKRKRPPYPKTRHISFVDVIKSRDLWSAIYFFIVFQIAMVLVAFGAEQPDPTKWIYSAVAISIYVSIHGLYAVKVQQKSKFRSEPVKIGQVIAVIAALYAVIYMISVASILLKIQVPEQANQVSLNALLATQFIPMTFIVSIVAPIIEELVFREYLPNALGPSYVSFFISSFLFVLLHGPTGIIGWLLYGAMSAAFTYLRLKGNNVFASVYGHILYNLSTVVLGML